MIKIQSFKIKHYEKANEFIKMNPPRSTDKQSGVIFHDGNIVIIYDDGVPNYNDRKEWLTSLLESERRKVFIIEQTIRTAELALVDENETLKKMVPKEYKRGKAVSANDIRKMLAASGNEEYLPAEAIDEMVKGIQSVENRIESLDNQLLIDRHEAKRVGLSIRATEHLLDEMNTKNV